jgi:conjugal transfer pilus assembly protein TraV
MKKLFAMSLMSGAVALLAGCANTLNTAENSNFGCGLPKGQTCKTPTAVYKSTHSEGQVTEYDIPVGVKSGEVGAPSKASATINPVAMGGHIHSTVSGPRPVRESAQIVRIWIAPWVDANDTLHLAQYQFAEVKPRTWTVGLEETKGGGYVIPHLALTGIGPVTPKTGEEAEGEKTGQSTPKNAGSGVSSEALDAINNATRGVSGSMNAPR